MSRDKMEKKYKKYGSWINLFPDVDKGESLEEITRARMEALLGHDLRDVRIHQTKQAGDIARKLGAEAFTVGKDVYSSEGALTSPVKRSSGLLAHELTHVIQQTNPLPVADINGGHLTGNSIELAGSPVQKQVQAPQKSSTGSSSVISNTEAAGMEAEANRTEQAARRNDEDRERTGENEIDVEAIADLVYRMMQREMIIEKDRMRR